MARHSQITTEDVRRAVQKLKGEGKTPSQRAIMGMLGGRRERIAELLAQIEVEDTPPTTAKQHEDGTLAIEHPEFKAWLDANLEALAHNTQQWVGDKLPYKSVPEGINLLAIASYMEQRERVSDLEAQVENLEAQAVRTPRPFLREFPLPFDPVTGGAERHLSLWFGEPWDERGYPNHEEAEDFDPFDGVTINLALALDLLRDLAQSTVDGEDGKRLAELSAIQWVHQARKALTEPVRPVCPVQGKVMADLDSYFEVETYYRRHSPKNAAWWEGVRRGTQRQQLAHLDRHASNPVVMGDLARTHPEFFKLVVRLCQEVQVPWCVDDSALAADLLSES